MHYDSNKRYLQDAQKNLERMIRDLDGDVDDSHITTLQEAVRDIGDFIGSADDEVEGLRDDLADKKSEYADLEEKYLELKV